MNKAFKVILAGLALSGFSVCAQETQQAAADAEPIRAVQQSATGIMTLESTIKGNDEQPRVLTIVPWQPPQTSVGIESVIYQRLQRQLSPMEPAELRRQLAFYQQQQTKEP